MGLATRLGWVMALLVTGTAAVIAVISYVSLNAVTYPRALSRMEIHLRLAASGVEDIAELARQDVLALAESASMRRATEALEAADGQSADNQAANDQAANDRAADGQAAPAGTPAPDTEWKAAVAQTFEAQLKAKLRYLQLRLLSRDDEGRELVRVERQRRSSLVEVIPEPQLQAKAQRPYFVAARDMAPGEIYISPVELNQEFGEIEVPYVPVLRVVTPVAGPDGDAVALLVVNYDMQSAFNQVRNAAEFASALYVINEEGDFLVHPDSSREFRFEFGERDRIQSVFPGLADLLSRNQPMSLETDDASGKPYVIAIVPVPLGQGRVLTVVEAVPRASFIVSATTAGMASVVGGLLALVIAVVAAVVIARRLSRPLERMTIAVANFGAGRPFDLPRDVDGEIGVLAGAFAEMTSEVTEKSESLAREIEEHKATLEKLRERSRRARLFGAAIETSPDAVIIIDSEGRIVDWNRAATELYGYKPEDAIGQSLELIVPEEQKEELTEILRTVRAGRQISALETIRRTSKGDLRDISLSVSPVLGEDGTIIGACKIERDITQQKLEDAKFRLAIEASPSGMIIADHLGVIQLANERVEELFGYTRKEIVGQEIEVLVPRSKAQVHVDLRESYSSDPLPREMGAGRTLHGRRKDDTMFPVEVGLFPIRNRKTELILCVIVDITERLAAEEAARAYNQKLEASNAELEQFAYVAAHDLQEPLRMVGSYTELLAERYAGELDERADKYIHYAVDGARRMRNLINDLLSYSRVGTQGKELEPIDANDVVQGILLSLSARIRDSGASVRCEKLPIVVADEGQLGQVFQNLISNAIKFRSEKTPDIHIGVEIKEGNAIFSVRDNGIGLDEKFSDRIFQMFQRLHQRGAFEGSGIGLTIAKRIVERHGGAIWLKSTPGEGTTFYFSIPLAGEEHYEEANSDLSDRG